MPIGTCEMPNLPLAEGCEILHVPPDRVVVDRRGFGLVKPEICDKEYGMHSHTVKDELQTISNRHLYATPVPDVLCQEWKLLKGQIRRIARAIGRVSVAKLDTLVRGRKGRRRNRFWLGIQRYWTNGIRRADSILTEMQKLELYETSKIPIKEDRGIQYRSVQYNVALARQLHGIEERLIGRHVDGYHPIMKGATPGDRCKRLALASRKFKNPRYVMLDHKRFDAHLHYLLVLLEHWVYLYCRRRDPELRKLLEWQLRNRGYSKGGIRYKVKGKRLSGDVNTSLGNCIINEAMLRAWLEASGVYGVVFLDGDDSVVIVEKEDYDKLVNVQAFMLKLGMETEMSYTDDFWQVEFCQSRPVNLDGDLVFARDPHKVLATIGKMPQSVTYQEARAILRGSAICELAMTPGMPVVQPLMLRLLDVLGKGRRIMNSKWQWKIDNYNLKPDMIVRDIDWRARYTLYRSWGIDAGSQLCLEGQPLTWCYGVGDVKERTQKKESEVFEINDLGDTTPRCDCGSCPTITDEDRTSLRYWGL